MNNLRLLTPEQHELLVERIALRFYPYVKDGNSREDRADAHNTARIEASRVLDDVYSVK